MIIKKKGETMRDFVEINNPYTLQFSYLPPKMIERATVTNEIINNFVRDVPTYRGIFITGVRGSGKTVMMGEIRNKISSNKNWICVDINPESNLLDSLARGLYLIPELKALFIKAKLDFSIPGIGVHLEKPDIVASNEEDAVRIMLSALKKAGKKLLVTIDEITYSKDVARFSHALSSFANAGYEIYVLMTGLADNISNIKNKKSLTFLYRAKVFMPDSLNITAIRNDYEKTLGIDREKAEELAYKTRGYSLAYQAVGYHCWNELCKSDNYSKVDFEKIDEQLDITLMEMAYDKIWDELSMTDRSVLEALARTIDNENSDLIKVENIRNTLNMSSDLFNQYRKRLIDAGIIDGRNYGHVRFCLPRFENYVENHI